MKPQEIAKRFLSHNFHDDNLLGLSMQPAQNRRGAATLIIRLDDADADAEMEIRFVSPSNVTFNADFDVLLDNAGCGNTSHTAAVVDPTRIKDRMKRLDRKNNITYETELPPLAKKLRRSDAFVWFRVFFFGGTLDVLAKNVVVRRRKKTKANEALLGTSLRAVPEG